MHQGFRLYKLVQVISSIRDFSILFTFVHYMFCQRIRVAVDSFLRYFIIVDLKQKFEIFLYLDETKRVNNLYSFEF